MRFGRYIASAALACGLIACGAAQAEPTHPPVPVDPTADAVRYAWTRDVNRLTFTVAANANQGKAWYEWAATVEAQQAAEAQAAQAAASRAEAERVTSQAHGAPKSPSGPQGGPPAPSSGGGGGAGGFLACTRQIESTNNYSINTGNGYYGAYQFDDQTWHAQGGTGHASDASPAEQDARAASLYAQRGNQPWGGRC